MSTGAECHTLYHEKCTILGAPGLAQKAVSGWGQASLPV